MCLCFRPMYLVPLSTLHFRHQPVDLGSDRVHAIDWHGISRPSLLLRGQSHFCLALSVPPLPHYPSSIFKCFMPSGLFSWYLYLSPHTPPTVQERGFVSPPCCAEGLVLQVRPAANRLWPEALSSHVIYPNAIIRGSKKWWIG
jgi:hypothetical protein